MDSFILPAKQWIRWSTTGLANLNLLEGHTICMDLPKVHTFIYMYGKGGDELNRTLLLMNTTCFNNNNNNNNNNKNNYYYYYYYCKNLTGK